MGVMECCRNNCDNIMCNEYNNVLGYICYECKSELEDLKPKSFADVKEFMDSRKGVKYLEDGEFNLDLVFQ